MSWPLVSLESLLEIKKGKKHEPCEIPSKLTRRFLQIDDLRNDNKIKYTLDKKGVFADKTDVIIAWDGANAGTIGFGKEGLIGSTLAKLSFDLEQVNTEYLGRFLQSKFRELRENCTGATIPHISKPFLVSLKIPLPPLEAQKQIAAVLEKSDQLRKDCKLMGKELNSLAQSVFIDMFGDPATNPKGWEIGVIGDLLASANYGTSEKSSTEVLKYPVLRMNNITYDGGWNFNSLKYMDMNEKDEDKYLVKDGDILFNRTNSKELVGKTAVYREEKPMAYAGYLVRARCNYKGNPDYISALMNSKYGKQTLQSMCKSIVGMANINAKEFQAIKIAKPPVELQNEYSIHVKKIQKFIKDAKKQEVEYSSAFNALMQKAFKGQLNLKTKAA